MAKTDDRGARLFALWSPWRRLGQHHHRAFSAQPRVIVGWHPPDRRAVLAYLPEAERPHARRTEVPRKKQALAGGRWRLCDDPGDTAANRRGQPEVWYLFRFLSMDEYRAIRSRGT